MMLLGAFRATHLAIFRFIRRQRVFNFYGMFKSMLLDNRFWSANARTVSAHAANKRMNLVPATVCC